MGVVFINTKVTVNSYNYVLFSPLFGYPYNSTGTVISSFGFLSPKWNEETNTFFSVDVAFALSLDLTTASLFQDCLLLSRKGRSTLTFFPMQRFAVEEWHSRNVVEHFLAVSALSARLALLLFCRSSRLLTFFFPKPEIGRTILILVSVMAALCYR